MLACAIAAVNGELREYRNAVNETERALNNQLLTHFKQAHRAIMEQVTAETRHGEIIQRIEQRIREYQQITKELGHLHADVTECQFELKSSLSSCMSCMLDNCAGLDAACAEENWETVLRFLGENPDLIKTMNQIGEYNFSKDLDLEITIPFINEVHADLSQQTHVILRTMFELGKDAQTTAMLADMAEEFNTSSTQIARFFQDLQLLNTPQQMHDLEESMNHTHSLMAEVRDLVEAMEQDQVAIDEVNVRYPTPVRQDKTIWTVVKETAGKALDVTVDVMVSTMDVTTSVACGARKLVFRSSCRRRRDTEITCSVAQFLAFENQLESCIEETGTDNCPACVKVKDAGITCVANLERDMQEHRDVMTATLKSESLVKQGNLDDKKLLAQNVLATSELFRHNLWVSPISQALLDQTHPAVRLDKVRFDPEQFFQQQGAVLYKDVVVDVVVDHLEDVATRETLVLQPVDVHNPQALGQEAASRFVDWYRAHPVVKGAVDKMMDSE
jgi:hypothetical protein